MLASSHIGDSFVTCHFSSGSLEVFCFDFNNLEKNPKFFPFSILVLWSLIPSLEVIVFLGGFFPVLFMSGGDSWVITLDWSLHLPVFLGWFFLGLMAILCFAASLLRRLNLPLRLFPPASKLLSFDADILPSHCDASLLICHKYTEKGRQSP